MFLGTYVFYPEIIRLRFYSDETIQKRFEPLTSMYGIKIVYEIGPDFFPTIGKDFSIWFGPSKDSATAKRIANYDLMRYPELLTKALERYPVRVIKRHLKAIHFASEIIDQNIKCGATVDTYNKVVYLAHNGDQSDEYSIETFHHEFSSIIKTHHSFYLTPWFNLNPKGFTYFRDIEGDGIYKKSKTAIAISLEGTEDDYEKGFMNTYGQTTFTNDFNTYAAAILTNPEKFKVIMEKYPRVKGKFKLFQEYYEQIDPIFTEEYLLNSKS